MSINYTPSQKKAIDTRGKSLLLSAAAGSGKTAVLVARILEIISDESNGINITDLLIVTFTNLAAAQMKERIYKELTAKIKEFPENKKLKRQLLYLSGAKIKTIHSFCLDVIRENIDSLQIPVNFRVADENEESAIKLSVINEFTEEKYREYDDAFLDIMNTYAYGRDDSGFIELLLYLDKYIQSIPEKNEYLDMCFSNLKKASDDFSKSIYADILMQHIKLILKSCMKKYDAAIEHGELSPDFDSYPPFFREEKNFIETLYAKNDIFELKSEAESYKFPPLPRKKTGTDNTFFKEIRKSFKEKGFASILKTLSCNKAEEEEMQREILYHTKNLMRLLKEFQEKLNEEKQKRGVLTFGDFEHLAYGLLKNSDGTPSRLAQNYQKSFYEILIDEYQDTSELQNTIFELISDGGKNLFMVGDVKQSIYKFRHAKPELFISKAKNFSEDGHQKELIMLSENFRSRKQVIDSVNRIFSDIMTVETSMTDYKKEMLVAGSSFPENENSDYTTEVLLFSGKHSDEEDENGSNEGRMIACRIKKLISEGFKVYDQKSNSHRPINYGDIVILTRDMTAKARCIYNSLSENGIPVSGEFEGSFYTRPEIMTIINILSAIDNPYNDFYLISLLKSPPFHFTETELLEIRMYDDRVPFKEALKHSDSEKAKNAFSFLEEYSQKASVLSVSRLITDIYGRLELYERFSSFEAYEQRLYHLDIFYKTACEFEKTQGGGLKSFLCYINKAAKNPKKVKNIYENKNPNSVKMLTMHKSKGLEFPVVFVAGLGKSLKGKDSGKKILMHPEVGIGADYISEKEMYITKTLCKSAVKIKQEYEQISEELRVLYVALTRAKEKLILTANIKQSDTKEALWETIRATGGHTLNSLYETACFTDWLMPSVYDSPFFKISVKEEIPVLIAESEENTEKRMTSGVNEAVFLEYPYKERTTLPLKVTVSYANKLTAQEEQPQTGRLTFEELDSTEDMYSGSEYGTYFHKMFELCDISEIKKGKSVKTVINELFRKNMIEQTEYSDEAIDGISDFFGTDLGNELLNSSLVKKETPFLVRIRANEIFDSECTEEILLQGTTDCYFTNENGLTLLDFKTDKNPDEKKIRKNYSKQIRLYAYALEKVTGLKVTRKVIYTVRNSKIIEI